MEKTDEKGQVVLEKRVEEVEEAIEIEEEVEVEVEDDGLEQAGTPAAVIMRQRLFVNLVEHYVRQRTTGGEGEGDSSATITYHDIPELDADAKLGPSHYDSRTAIERVKQ